MRGTYDGNITRRSNSTFFHIDIEEQDYPDADCKFMISLWHEPQKCWKQRTYCNWFK